MVQDRAVSEVNCNSSWRAPTPTGTSTLIRYLGTRLTNAQGSSAAGIWGPGFVSAYLSSLPPALLHRMRPQSNIKRLGPGIVDQPSIPVPTSFQNRSILITSSCHSTCRIHLVQSLSSPSSVPLVSPSLPSSYPSSPHPSVPLFFQSPTAALALFVSLHTSLYAIFINLLHLHLPSPVTKTTRHPTSLPCTRFP